MSSEISYRGIKSPTCERGPRGERKLGPEGPDAAYMRDERSLGLSHSF